MSLDYAALHAQIKELESENAILKQRLAKFEAIEDADKTPEQPGGSSLGRSLTKEEAEKLLEEAFTQAKNQAEPHRYQKHWKAYDVEVQTFPERPHFDHAVSHPDTQCVIFDGCPNDPYHPASMPIYQTSTFVQPNISEFGPYDYTRSGNPTRTAVEVLVSKLEGSHASFAFTSGMSALNTVVGLLSAGDTIVCSADLYGGMHRLVSQVAQRVGINTKFVDTSVDASISVITDALTEDVKLVHIESPTNPLMKITDLRKLASIVHSRGALLSIDCTMMTSVRCQPLELGCDIVVHSGTKFFCGHSDTMSGFVSIKDPALGRRIGFLQNAQGTALAPFDCWLLLRGMKTLALRVERQEMNAIAVARFLSRQSRFVKKLHYTGIDPKQLGKMGSLSVEAFKTHHSQCSGPGSVLSFETGDKELSQQFVDACKLFKLTVSFGSCNSLVEMPCVLSHASIPADKRTLPDDLVRLSVGIEHVEDLITDLAQAISKALETKQLST